jgi:hypothetical protein
MTLIECMRRAEALLRLAVIGTFAISLGGCLDAVVYPLHSERSVYADCPHGAPSEPVVNYGCDAGAKLAH